MQKKLLLELRKKPTLLRRLQKKAAEEAAAAEEEAEKAEEEAAKAEANSNGRLLQADNGANVWDPSSNEASVSLDIDEDPGNTNEDNVKEDFPKSTSSGFNLMVGFVVLAVVNLGLLL